MTKVIFFLLALASLAAAQTSTIRDTLLNAQNRPLSGSITIEWKTPFTTAGGLYIAAGKVTVPVVNGVFMVSLFPNDTATPINTSYTATYAIFGYSRIPEIWLVPTSATVLAIRDVFIASPPDIPASPWQITFGQLPTPPASGVFCVEAMNAVIGWYTCSGGSGGSGSSGITGAPSSWPAFKTVATTGSYTDLINKPTIPAAQVNADWSAAFGASQILNKPTIPSNTTQITEAGNLYFTNARALAAMAGLYQTPIASAPGTWPTFATVATSGLYADLTGKPTIPAAQVNADWSAVSGLGQILNKPTLGTAAAQATSFFAPAAGSASITTLGTIATGTWQGTVIAPTYGGTGVNNGAKTITLGAALATTGAGAATFAFPATAQTYTLPTVSSSLYGISAANLALSGTAIGPVTLNAGMTGFYDTAVGGGTLAAITAGWSNTGVGSTTLASTTSGSYNTGIGFQAGYTATPANANVSGNYNTWIGYNTGPGNSTQHVLQTVIGANASATCDNCVVLGGATEVLRLVPSTFASLPTCAAGTEGSQKPLTDSTVNTWGTTIAGGGANHVLAYCDGTNWTVAAK